MSDLSDHTIAIDVATAYLQDQSKPDEDLYYFAYTIGIRNTGQISARLLRRRWLILDATGHPREIAGDGVVGEQPLLRPGDRFEYTSSTFFKTPYGTMDGAYTMVDDEGTEFEAKIPRMVFCVPRVLH
ncbi:MAG: Co2+/Mg2+ efflux protein ApaG [Lysobacteraceae bacterium]|nr:MAG: Co2+/Mg2+ efflux protein ApaG [Xanthomonadaceae bacterium]